MVTEGWAVADRRQIALDTVDIRWVLLDGGWRMLRAPFPICDFQKRAVMDLERK